ncbi:MAG: isoprenylcysteine carboxylmethyltransferase family protein [Anaerolineae bacterium]|nr:isoprenylcysteine carboxylmethyltransferase family protein [Anaerolineae bacterium]
MNPGLNPGRHLATRLRWRNVPLPEANLAAIVLAALLHLAFPRRLLRARWIGLVLGWPLVLAGAGLALQAASEAGEMDVSAPDKLLTTGAYAASRNPMYVGWGLVQAGISLITNTLWPLVCLPLSMAYTHFADIRKEEQFLKREFGDEYLEYMDRVPRYL